MEEGKVHVSGGDGKPSGELKGMERGLKIYRGAMSLSDSTHGVPRFNLVSEDNQKGILQHDFLKPS